jgi:hypothetical protein
MDAPCQHHRIDHRKKNPIQVIFQAALLHILSLAEDVGCTVAKLEQLLEDLGGNIAFVSPINQVGILCV